MRSFGHILFWLYRALSLVIIIIGLIQLIMFRNDFYFALKVLIPIIIIDLLLLCVTTLVSIVRKGGWPSIIQLLRSTRFRLTLWYTLILAIVLVIFSSIVYETVSNDFNGVLSTNLHSLLTQVASTYNTQTGRISLPPNGNRPVSKVTGNGTVQNKNAGDEIVLLMTPQGQVLQMPNNYGDSLSGLATETASMWTGKGNQLPYPPLDSIGTNMQMYEFGGLQFYDLPDGTYVFDQAALVTQQQQVVALLVVGIPSDVHYWLGDLFSVLETALPLVLLLSIVGGYWLAGRAMRPVQAITRTAQQISETDLRRRLKLKQRDELGELAATFDSMLDRLEAAFERQRQFTADASHELRTPLSIVDLEATRALARELTTQEYQQTITTIQQENRHMTRLVTDLLVLARADAGQAKLKPEEVDLSEVVVDTVERLAPLAQQTGIPVNVAPLPELTMLGDRTYLVQLLTNIIENALKYSAGSGTHVDIDLRQQQRQGKEWAALCIRDDGPGIAKEHLPHLFERFYRVDQSRTHSQGIVPGCAAEELAGNGLGLSIAQWIAQVHGGEIQVQSAPGHGSVFAIWLPLEPTRIAQQERHFNTHMPHKKNVSKQKESTRMSQHMDFRESNHGEPSSHSIGYQETPAYNSYATGFGSSSAGQKLSGAASMSQKPTAGQRLALAIVSLVLWTIALSLMIAIASASQAPSFVAVLIFLILLLFAILIAVINIVFNRGA